MSLESNVLKLVTAVEALTAALNGAALNGNTIVGAPVGAPDVAAQPLAEEKPAAKPVAQKPAKPDAVAVEHVAAVKAPSREVIGEAVVTLSKIIDKDGKSRVGHAMATEILKKYKAEKFRFVPEDKHLAFYNDVIAATAELKAS
jgi:hypothetical protein